MSNGNKLKKRSKQNKNSRPVTKSSKSSCKNIIEEKQSSLQGVQLTDEHLTSLIPVIADLMTLIANRVHLIISIKLLIFIL